MNLWNRLIKSIDTWVGNIGPDGAETVNYESLTKLEIDKLGKENGIQLDRRKKKATMIGDLKAHLGE